MCPNKKNWQKTFKEVSHVSSNKEKKPEKSFLKVPLSLPPEKMSKMFQKSSSSVLEQEKRIPKKKVTSHLTPYFLL